MMMRKTCVCLAAVALLLTATLAKAAPVRLARTPDYHAGKIAFSYLGDIWVVNEDGSNPVRITDHTARDINPRFSPDGGWIAFSSNRYGNNDVFVIPATGGAPRRLTYHTGNEEVVGWTPDSEFVVFRATQGDGVFPNTATLYKVPAKGGPETPLPVDWGWWGSFSPDGRYFLFNRHPAVWSRKHYRGAYAGDIWVADLQAKAYRQVLGGERFNRLWPMWGPNGEIYFVADPLPNEKAVKPGSPEARQTRNNIYKIAASGAGSPTQVTKHADGNVFFPSMSSDRKVIVYEGDFGLWKLDLATGRASEVKVDIAADEKVNQLDMVAITNEADSFDLSPSSSRAVISSRNQIFTIATDRGDITLVANDKGTSRNETPQWSPDGKSITFVSDRSGRQEVYVIDAAGKSLKKVSYLDTDKGPLLWSPDSKSLLYGSTDKKLYLYTLADGKTSVVTSSTIAQVRSPAFSPDGKWVTFVKQDPTLRSHVYIAPVGGGEERHIIPTIWRSARSRLTADGRFIVYTTSSGTGGGVASTGGRAQTEMQLMVPALRAQDKDPLNRDIDRRSRALRRGGGAKRQAVAARRGAAAPGQQQPVEVRIDWDGSSRGARIQVRATRLRPHSRAQRSVGLHGRPTPAGVPAAGPAQSPRGDLHRERRRGQRTGARPAGAARHDRGWRARGWRHARRRGRQHGLLDRRPHALLPLRPQHLRGPGERGHRPGCRGGGRTRRRTWRHLGGRARRGRPEWRDGAPSDLHHQPGTRPQGAAPRGLRGRLAGHEEPLLRPEDARRRLERRQADLRCTPRQPRRRRGVAHRDDADDRRAERLAHGCQRRRPPGRAPGDPDALPGLRARGRPVRLLPGGPRVEGRPCGPRVREGPHRRLHHRDR
jgi:Tol biopolymer transport system component